MLPQAVDPLAVEERWRMKALPNGMTLIHAPLPHDARTYLGVLVKAGSRCEDSKLAGVSHFLEHMMFRGSQHYPSFAALADAFEWLGGEWNAATGQEYTEFSYTGPYTSLGQAISLFADFICFPLLLDVEKERQVILREIEDELNDYGHSTDLGWHMARLLWPGSSLAQPIIGSKDSVNGITLEAIKSFRQTHYRASQLAICVVGGPDSPDVMRLLEEKFSSYPLGGTGVPAPWPPAAAVGAAAPQFRGPACTVVEHADNQYQLQLSFTCAGEWSAKAPLYELITYMLVDGYSARLPLCLREQLGLVYDIEAHLAQFADCGSLDIEAAVACEQIFPFLKETCRVLARFAKEGPGEQELEKAKVRAMADLELLPHKPTALGFRLAWHSLCQQDGRISSSLKALQGIKAAEVKAVARELLTAQNCGLVLLGPQRKELASKLTQIITQTLG